MPISNRYIRLRSSHQLSLVCGKCVRYRAPLGVWGPRKLIPMLFDTPLEGLGGLGSRLADVLSSRRACLLVHTLLVPPA